MQTVHTTNFIKFIEHPTRLGKKTTSYTVANKEDNNEIGIIKWHSPFYKYSFFPTAYTVFDETCLKDIAIFLDKIGIEHKEKQRLIDIATGKTEK